MNNHETNVVWRYTGEIEDARELVDFASEKIGVEISERTAYRILSGDVKPLSSVMDAAPKSGFEGDEKQVEPSRIGSVTSRSSGHWIRERNLSKRISVEDMRYISQETKKAIDQMGEKYFLRCLDYPRIRRRGQKLNLTVYLEELDEE